MPREETGAPCLPRGYPAPALNCSRSCALRRGWQCVCQISTIKAREIMAPPSQGMTAGDFLSILDPPWKMRCFIQAFQFPHQAGFYVFIFSLFFFFSPHLQTFTSVKHSLANNRLRQGPQWSNVLFLIAMAGISAFTSSTPCFLTLTLIPWFLTGWVLRVHRLSGICYSFHTTAINL